MNELMFLQDPAGSSSGTTEFLHFLKILKIALRCSDVCEVLGIENVCFLSFEPIHNYAEIGSSAFNENNVNSK